MDKLKIRLETIEEKIGSTEPQPPFVDDALDWHLRKIENLIEESSGAKLPDPEEGDEGKVPTVKSDLSGFEYKEKADLVNGKVPESQLPSYVDDVLEYDDLAHFPAEGEEGKIYVAKDTGNIYRWSGSEYIQVGGQEIPVTDVEVNGESVLEGTIAKITLPSSGTKLYKHVIDWGTNFVITIISKVGTPFATAQDLVDAYRELRSGRTINMVASNSTIIGSNYEAISYYNLSIGNNNNPNQISYNFYPWSGGSASGSISSFTDTVTEL